MTTRYVLAAAAILILLAVGLAALLADRGGVAQPSPTPSAASTSSPAVTATGGPTATTTSSPATARPSPTPTAAFGTISGEVSYPSSSRPELEVYAIDVSDPQRWYSATAPGFTGPDTGPATSPPPDLGKHYSIQVPPGTYHVVAYIKSDSSDSRGTLGPGLYSQYVLCGLRASCTDHTLIEVTVAAGETRNDIDPADWYYQPGQATYPPRPTPR